jgi:hypothetical protein
MLGASSDTCMKNEESVEHTNLEGISSRGIDFRTHQLRVSGGNPYNNDLPDSTEIALLCTNG